MIVDGLKKVAKWTLYQTGFYHLLLGADRRRSPGKRLLVLVYHDIWDPSGAAEEDQKRYGLRPTMTVSQFEMQLDVLASHFQVVSLEDGARELCAKTSEQSMDVAITFDDGYQSFADLALPLLRQRGFTATMYLPTDFIGTSTAFWWDELTSMILGQDHNEIESRDINAAIGVVPDDKGLRDSTVQGKMQALLAVERHLALLPHSERVERIEALKELFLARQNLTPLGLPIMDWDQVRSCRQSGITFGAHTMSHLNMAGAPGQVLKDEIEGSVDRMNEELGTPTTLFAYPYGMEPLLYKPAMPALKEFGILNARTMWPGFNDSSTNPYLFLRADPGTGDSAFESHRCLLTSGRERVTM